MEQLKIYTEQLRNGKRETLDLTLPSNFLDLHEQDLAFENPIQLKGEVYAADDQMIVHLKAKTEGKMPCSICNQITPLSLQTEDIYHTIPFNEISTQIFDLSDLVREEIVLFIPQFIECNHGHCPERPSVAKFIKEKSDHHFPFADL